MVCENCNSLLSAYVDGELAPKKARWVRAHVSQCEHCRQDLSEIKTLRRLMGGLDHPEPSAAFWTRAIRSAQVRHSYRPRTLALIAGRAALFAVTASALVIALTSNLPDTRPSETSAQTAPVLSFALISLHASSRIARPLADSGSLRSAVVEGDSEDWAEDQRLDVE